MKSHVAKLAVVPLALLLVGLFSLLQLSDESTSKEESAMTSIGNVQTLVVAYDRWKAAATQKGIDRSLTLSLNYSRGLSAEFTKARGQATLDLVDGSVSVEVWGLNAAEAFDVWLIDNRSGPGYSVKPEPGDVMARIGGLRHEEDLAELQVYLGYEALTGFELDLVVVARAGQDPGKAGLLFGSPSLFQRLYYSEQRVQLAALSNTGEPLSPASAHHSLLLDPLRVSSPFALNLSYRSLLSAPFQVLVPNLAHAAKLPLTGELGSLVAEGEDDFFKETFEGNGRVCGTCHPFNNNFTIDPASIAKLSDDDPLFVAEFNPVLAQLEQPALMREFGLILENVDGLEDPTNKFVMRGVPHTLALPTSLTQDPTIAPPSAPAPAQMTGWSGDGAPGDGSLRQFSVGAVIQHFTKSLNRIEGVDFRLPDDDELDAMEAFMLSLGRQEDLALPLPLKGTVPSRGQDLFINGTGDPDFTGRCAACHSNAGALQDRTAQGQGFVNRNFDTGVENLPDQPPRLFAELFSEVSMPRDGGFGKECVPEAIECNAEEGPFGDGEFNTPPVVEAADSGPFFHNNVITTIEGAVDFYNSDAFNNDRGAKIKLAATQVEAVAAFLRVINALENIRSSLESDYRVINALVADPTLNVNRVLRFSRAEIRDAIGVLSDVSLHLDAVEHLKEARELINQAIDTGISSEKIELTQ